MAVSPFDEEAVRRIVASTKSVADDPETTGDQVLGLYRWIAEDASETGDNLSNLLYAFLAVTSRLVSMEAGSLSAIGEAQNPPGPGVDVDAVLDHLEELIALSRDKWERRN